jgi:hypothetical protein
MRQTSIEGMMSSDEDSCDGGGSDDGGDLPLPPLEEASTMSRRPSSGSPPKQSPKHAMPPPAPPPPSSARSDPPSVYDCRPNLSVRSGLIDRSSFLHQRSEPSSEHPFFFFLFADDGFRMERSEANLIVKMFKKFDGACSFNALQKKGVSLTHFFPPSGLEEGSISHEDLATLLNDPKYMQGARSNFCSTPFLK